MSIFLLLAQYLQFILPPWLAKQIMEDKAIAADGGPLHLPINMGVLPVPAFASCGSERGICGLVTSIFFLNFISNSYLEDIFERLLYLMLKQFCKK